MSDLVAELEALYRASGYELVARDPKRTVLRKGGRHVELAATRPLGRDVVEVRVV